MLTILNFIQQVLSTPAIFVGLIALLGLLLQKKDAQTCFKGTIKTILGFIVLNAGADVVQDAIYRVPTAFDSHAGAVCGNISPAGNLFLTENYYRRRK